MTSALDLVAGWPVHAAAAGYVTAAGGSGTTGTDRTFPLASVTKLLTTYAVLVAVEERTVDLDEPAGDRRDHPAAPARPRLRPPLRGRVLLTRPETTRIYSNTGIELAAAHLAAAAGFCSTRTSARRCSSRSP